MLWICQRGVFQFQPPLKFRNLHPGLRFCRLSRLPLLLLLVHELRHFLMPLTGGSIGLCRGSINAYFTGTRLRRWAIAEMGLAIGVCPLVDGGVRKRTKGYQK